MTFKNLDTKVAIGAIYIWIGFVCSISFMEAWLKFQAPGIDTKLGVGIGQLVFSALNKVEITLVLIVLISIVKTKINLRSVYVYLFIAFSILFVQTIWLLPSLLQHAQSLINDVEVPHNNYHLVYIILEVIKLIALVLLGSNLLKKYTYNE